MSRACWICGASADSAEHRFKKADLVRAHGRGPYIGPAALYHYRSGHKSLVQGPNSKLLKYSPSLCKHCNTTYTQPFDRAYDAFISWMMENEEAVLRQRFLDFEEIYGSNWEESQRDLYKYFAKSFGCRLVDATTNVPPDIVECIVRNSFCTHLCLTLAVNEDTLLLPSRHRNGFIGKGKLFSWTPRSAPRSDDIFTWDEHVSWLTTCYWYNNAPDDACGSSWIADRKLIHLGSFAPLNKRERNELIKKTRDYK